MKKRNSMIDAMRLIYAVVVVFCHSAYLTEPNYTVLWKGGYMAVEFFFIVSGYLLASSVYNAGSNQERLGSDTITFVVRKFKGLFPYAVFAWVISFIILHLPNSFQFKILLKDAINSVWPFFFVNMTGLNGYETVGATWYISAMLLTMLMIYPLMRRNKNLYVWAIAPLVTLFAYGFLAQSENFIGPSNKWSGILYLGILRAAAGLSLGCLCYGIVQKLAKINFTLLSKIWLTIVEIGGYIASLVLMQIRYVDQLDFIIVLVLAVAIILSFSGKTYTHSVFDSKWFSWTADFSLALYLCHGRMQAFVVRMFPDIVSYGQRLVLYLGCSFLAAALCLLFVKTVRKMGTRYKGTMKKYFVQT